MKSSPIGWKVTSSQRFLGHKEISSTMIYARAHDQNVADDYFMAMERVEQRLDIVPEPVEETKENVVNVLPAKQLLAWVERLALPELCQQERLEIAESLKQILSLNCASELSPSASYAE